jgi:hypothetical protein
MYKVIYCLTNGAVRFKAFNELKEATIFANEQPTNAVLEIKYYDENPTRKQDRT